MLIKKLKNIARSSTLITLCIVMSLGISIGQFAIPTAIYAQSPSPVAPSAAPTDEDTCDTSGSPLSWIVCPIIDLGSKFTDFVFNDIVRPFLEDVPVSADAGDPTYEAWKSFRTIGNIILIAALLMVVYAQAKGDK